MIDLNNKSNKLIVVYMETCTQEVEIIIVLIHMGQSQNLTVQQAIQEILANLKDSISCRARSLATVQLNQNYKKDGLKEITYQVEKLSPGIKEEIKNGSSKFAVKILYSKTVL